MTDHYETELTTSRADAAAALGGVVDGLLAGSIRLGDDGEAVAVDVPEELSLEVDLEAEDDLVSLEVEMEWPDGTGEASPVASLEEAPEAPENTPVEVGATDATESLARFELFRDRADEWRWRLRHRNGNVIATAGEGYTRKHNARKGLRSVVQNAPDAEVSEDTLD